MMLILVAGAMAKQPNPEIYWGYVYMDDAIVPDGAVLTIETTSGELLVNKTIPKSGGHPGSYSIKIKFDDLLTNATDEGAESGESLIWKLNGVEVVSPVNDTANIGETNNDLNVTAVTIPVIVVGDLNYSSISIGETINDSLSIQNTGDGYGNVTIDLVYNVSEYSITDNLPDNLILVDNSSTNRPIEITPTECATYDVDLVTLSYDTAGRLRSTKTQDLTFNVTGPNLKISDLSSSTIIAGTITTISVLVQNIGSESVNGFNVTLNDGTTTLNTYANYTLAADENLTVGILWTPISAGDYNLVAEVIQSEIECNAVDNSYNETVTVQAVVSGGSGGSGGSSGGSSGGGSSGGGSSGGSSCNPTWNCTDWGACDTFSGTRTRICTDEKECSQELNKPQEIESCRTSSCADGLLNGDEEEIDCGGSCEPCAWEEEQETQSPKNNLITGGAIISSGTMTKLLDFPSLLLAFITIVLVMGYMFMYKNMTAQSYENYSARILDDPETKQKHAYVPFEYLMQAVDMIDQVNNSKLSTRKLKEQFEKQKYSPIVARLAIKAANSTKVVMKNEAKIRNQLDELKIGKEGYDYISYSTLSKSTKLMAELLKVIKDDKEKKKIVKLAVAGLDKLE